MSDEQAKSGTATPTPRTLEIVRVVVASGVGEPEFVVQISDWIKRKDATVIADFLHAATDMLRAMAENYGPQPEDPALVIWREWEN